jgi:hypothetical protein
MSTSRRRRGLSYAVGIGALALSIRPASPFAPTEVYRPVEAISYVLGSIRAVGYFQTVDGQCEVTLMIAEVFDPDRAAPRPATRLHFAMRPRQAAALTSEEGPEMVLSCGGEAATVEVARDAAKP